MALAVKAMIGRWALEYVSRARMIRVTSKPSGQRDQPINRQFREAASTTTSGSVEGSVCAEKFGVDRFASDGGERSRTILDEGRI